MSIGILYERSETDELGIKHTAEEHGINLTYIPFRKIAVRLDKGGYSIRNKGKNYSKAVEDVKVVLNRAQSKNRRLVAAELFETLGKHVLNPSIVEYICSSKLRTILHLWKEEIQTPETVYVPCDTHEKVKTGKSLCNEDYIADLLQQEFGQLGIVVKPDAGTHGKNVRLAYDRNCLLTILGEVQPSIINPVGVLAQRYVQKWFYDLRIIVTKQSGKQPHCYAAAIARAGFKDFRTNTFLGNMVFGVNLPSYIRNAVVKCGKAIGKGGQAWVLAIDAMIDVGEDKTADDTYVKSNLDKLEPAFNLVRTVKQDPTKFTAFSTWNKKLEEAFQNYRDQEAYSNVKEVIEESVKKNQRKILFHEANACPEFWEQTRLVAGINVAEPLLKCAQSLIDSDNRGLK
jgi:glutathione synthase/RimK-type ligase-like ATP-grasp enzyme